MTDMEQQHLAEMATILGFKPETRVGGWLQVGTLNKTKDAEKVIRYLKDERRKQEKSHELHK